MGLREKQGTIIHGSGSKSVYDFSLPSRIFHGMGLITVLILVKPDDVLSVVPGFAGKFNCFLQLCVYSVFNDGIL